MDKTYNGSFLRLWLATALSNIADGEMLLGLPLLAVQLTRSPTLMSLVSVVAAIGQVVERTKCSRSWYGLAIDEA